MLLMVAAAGCAWNMPCLEQCWPKSAQHRRAGVQQSMWTDVAGSRLPSNPLEGEAWRRREGHISVAPACLNLPSTPGGGKAGR
jgi:hypothetical protein